MATKTTNVDAEQPQQVQPEGVYVPMRTGLFGGKSAWLTLEYALAMGSIVMAIMIIIDIVNALFGGWAGLGLATSFAGSGWMLGFLNISTVTASTGLVASSVAAVLLSLASMILFGRVSRTIPDREGYTKRLAYKVVTYGALGVLVLPAVALIAKMISILLNSLLLIGYGNAAAVYKSLYVAEFLPYLVSLGVVAFGLYAVAKIINGVNLSRIFSAVILSVAAVSLIASAVTVSVQIRYKSSDNAVYSRNDSYGVSRD